jgi:hypothetical protein
VYRVVSGVLAAGIACTLAGVLGAGTIGMSTNLPQTALDLREGAGGRVQVDVPEPGAAATFHVTARPLTDGPTELVLVVEDGAVLGTSGRAAARVADEVVLTLTDDTGTVLVAGSAADLRGAVVDLGRTDDVPVTVHGEASLPADRPSPRDGATVALDVRVAGAGDVRTAGSGGPRASGSVVAAPGDGVRAAGVTAGPHLRRGA